MDERIQAGQFKTECLKLMDRVKRTRRPIIITKRNVPVAKLVPLEQKEEKVFGKLKGTIVYRKEIITPIEESWNADT